MTEHESRVRGSAVVSRIRYIREHADESVLREIKASMDPSLVYYLDRGVLPHAWVPLALFIDINVRADERLGQGDLALCREMGRYGAHANLPTLYRVFMRFGSVGYVLRKASRLFREHYDSGALAVEELGPKAARLIITEFAEPHRAHCESVLGWASGAVELTGEKVAEAREETCRTAGADACRFYVAWH